MPTKGVASSMNDDFQLNIHRIIEDAARVVPDREVVSGTGDDQLRYTYKEACERVRRFADSLSGLGAGPGDRVGILAWNTHRHFESFFAIPATGATFLQLNLRLHPETLTYIGNHASPKYLIVDESLLELAEPFAPDVDSIEAYVVLTDGDLDYIETDLGPLYSYEELVEEGSADYEFPTVDETTACSACYTTGTTGRPKGVYYSHRSNYLFTMQYGNSLGFTMEDTIFQTVPMFHVQGSMTPFLAPYLGAKLVLPGRYTMEEPAPLIDLITDEGATFVTAASPILRPILNYLREQERTPDWSDATLMVGATAPGEDLIRGFEELTGADMLHLYGGTESTSFVTASITRPSDERSDEKLILQKQKQGIPIPGTSLKLIDPETGEELPHDGDSVGEVYIRGPWVASSYFDDERSEEAFTDDGFWKTGDAGTIDEEGYLQITDRLKHIIKSGGEWISSADMANKLLEHPQVEDATVVGLEHPDWEERPFALVTTAPDASLGREDLDDLLQEKFADWQLPDDIAFVEQIPKTSVGKDDKASILDKYEGRYLP